MTNRQRTKKEPSARGVYIISSGGDFVKDFRLWEMIKLRIMNDGDLWDFCAARTAADGRGNSYILLDAQSGKRPQILPGSRLYENSQAQNINPLKVCHMFFVFHFTNPREYGIISSGLPMARFSDYRSIPTLHPPIAELWVHPNIFYR